MPQIESFEIDDKAIALTGLITGKLPIASLCEFHKPSIIILESKYGHLNEQAIEWALRNKTKFCVAKNIREMVEQADAVLSITTIFHLHMSIAMVLTSLNLIKNHKRF